ncbi:Hypothetical protein SMAX5B_008604 [Scophthalmus maximus]|uniref:Uncharacterized protein n=1 Tax=Scophthalmus maximus TaxID=52904 RepID=A0A2U9CD84_SCOMX|nr:Hypothetical protein SMAX5B_008604 [Scophthalmus maximus]
MGRTWEEHGKNMGRTWNLVPFLLGGGERGMEMCQVRRATAHGRQEAEMKGCKRETRGWRREWIEGREGIENKEEVQSHKRVKGFGESGEGKDGEGPGRGSGNKDEGKKRGQRMWR